MNEFQAESVPSAKVDEFIQREPLYAILGAIGIGVALGMLARSIHREPTRRERLMDGWGKFTDALIDARDRGITQARSRTREYSSTAEDCLHDSEKRLERMIAGLNRRLGKVPYFINPLTDMKAILSTALAAALICGAVAQESTTTNVRERAGQQFDSAKEKARSFWIKSKGYLSEDPATFTQGAQQTLADLNKEIGEITAKAGATPPPYFQTRIESLRQQHEYLTGKLKELTPEALKTRMSGPRYAFDQCVGSLEEAVDQADDEADVLAKANAPQKTAP